MVPAGTLGAHSSPLTSLSADGSLVGSTCASELKLWEVDLAAAASAAAAASSAASPDASATDRQLSPASGPAAAPDAAADPAASAALQPLTLAQQQAGRALAGRCLSTVSIGLPMPSPVLEPKVVVCGARRIAALSNCSAPVPSSVVRVYCAHPATAGALLRELSVNAAADMAFAPGRLLVAAAFHGRSLGGPERAFTIVVHCWDTDTWAWTRLVSPRCVYVCVGGCMDATVGCSLQGCPMLHGWREVDEDAKRCVGARCGYWWWSQEHMPVGASFDAHPCGIPCSVTWYDAWLILQQPVSLFTGSQTLPSYSAQPNPPLSSHPFASTLNPPTPSFPPPLRPPRLSTIFPVTSGQGLPLIHFTQEWLLCATPTRSTGPIPSCSVNAWRLPRRSAAAAAAAAANGGSSSSDRALRLRAAGGGDQQQEGRGGGQQQPAQRPPVLLVVGDSEGHDPWYPVLAETGPGRLAVLTSTPDKLLLATPEGQVRAATICPRAEAAAVVPARAVAKAASVLAAANAAAQL